MEHRLDIHSFCEVCGKPYFEIMMEKSRECNGGKVVDIRRARCWKMSEALVDAVMSKMDGVD